MAASDLTASCPPQRYSTNGCVADCRCDTVLIVARQLADNLGERFEKPLEMHMQRIVDGFVRSAHGAGMFYDGKAAVARNLSSKIANEDRDEDRLGVDGTENRAQRACGFAATVGLQAYALLAAAHGAVDAYAYVCGSDWKPYEGMGGQAVSRQAISIVARQSKPCRSDNQRHIHWWNISEAGSWLSSPKPPSAVA